MGMGWGEAEVNRGEIRLFCYAFVVEFGTF